MSLPIDRLYQVQYTVYLTPWGPVTVLPQKPVDADYKGTYVSETHDAAKQQHAQGHDCLDYATVLRAKL